VEVIVTEVTRGTVKIGIVAPKHTTILRGELRDAVEAANRAATESVDNPSQLPLALPGGVAPWGRR
jgi:carbon storage regulator CsrA